MVKVGIVGVSGYSGAKAFELLLRHPSVRVTYVSANNTEGKISEIWPRFYSETDLECRKFDLKQALQLSDLFILAVPHTAAMTIAPSLIEAGKRAIDLSADYRLNNIIEYEQWYGAKHTDPQNLKKAVYGLPELFREDIKKAKLISNPGCYPTAAILGLAPLAVTHNELIDSIIIDAKSGASGAGRKVTANFIFTEVNENFKAYKVLNHPHTPEINLYLSKVGNKPINVNFVPHLLPINHGILETIYVQSKDSISLKEAHDIYRKFYKTETFVRILPVGQQPELKNVVGTNYCDIALAMGENKRLLVITSVIDNLIKGASGQAVQNLNIMCGFKETEGLI